MEDIKIESKISLKDYTRLLYLLTYRKPVIIMISLLGLLLVVFSVLYFLGEFSAFDKPPYLALLTGLFVLIIFPLSISLSAKRNFRSEPFLREKILYTFCPDQITIRGDTFSQIIAWDRIYRFRRLGKWFLFYRDKYRLNFMFRNSLSQEQRDRFVKLIKQKRIP